MSVAIEPKLVIARGCGVLEALHRRRRSGLATACGSATGPCGTTMFGQSMLPLVVSFVSIFSSWCGKSPPTTVPIGVMATGPAVIRFRLGHASDSFVGRWGRSLSARAP